MIMASISKRGNSYVITVSLGYGEDKKQIREYTTYTPKAGMSKRAEEKAVEAFANEFETRVKSGTYLEGEKLTLHAFVERWWTEYAEQELEEPTQGDYEYVLRRILPKLGHYKLTEITTMQVRRFLNDLKKDGARLDGRKGRYSDKTIMKTKQVLSVILSTAVEWGIIESNPCKAIKYRKTKVPGDTKIKYFTAKQAKTFLQAIDKPLTVSSSTQIKVDHNGKTYCTKETVTLDLQFRFLFNLALFSGCRREEILALTWEDFDFKDNFIVINKAACRVKGETKIKATKTESSIRNVFVSAGVMDMAREYKRQQQKIALMLGDEWVGYKGKQYDRNFVFTQWNGKMMYLTTPSSKMRKVIQYINNSIEDEKDKLPYITLHGLRHTHATVLIASNIDAVTVAGRLGHSDTSTTLDIYAHALKEKNQKAAQTLADVMSFEVKSS